MAKNLLTEFIGQAGGAAKKRWSDTDMADKKKKNSEIVIFFFFFVCSWSAAPRESQLRLHPNLCHRSMSTSGFSHDEIFYSLHVGKYVCGATLKKNRRAVPSRHVNAAHAKERHVQ